MATFDTTHDRHATAHQDQLHVAAHNELVQLEESTFWNAKVNIKAYFLIPSGLEIPLGLIYLLLFPYAIGLLVIFLFIARHDFDSFLVLDPFTIIPVWAIGYEVSALLVMVGIAIAAMRFHYRKKARIALLKQILAIKRRDSNAQQSQTSTFS